MSRVIVAYRVRQNNISQVGEHHRVNNRRRALKRVVATLNPKKVCLTDLKRCIGDQRDKGPAHEAILMLDMNK